MSSPETSSSGSSTVYVTPLTNSQIQSIFPDINFVDAENPGPNNAPPPPDNFWEKVGWFIADEITMWVYKKFGWLLIIEALEEGE